MGVREKLRKQIREKVLSQMDGKRCLSDDEIGEMIDQAILESEITRRCPVTEKSRLRKEVFHAIRGLDVLQPLLEDDTVTEIMVNGPEHIFIEREGKLLKYDEKFESSQKLADVIQQIVAQVNRTVNEAVPIADARLLDGSRVSVVLPPVAIDGAALTIRKFSKQVLSMEKLTAMEAVTAEAAGFLKLVVRSGYNILVTGGTGSGKTTFLNVLSDYIPKEERLITIEDSAELQIQGADNLIRLEMRASNSEGSGEITIRDLVKAALRMRPSRIIIGEVRDAAALDLLNAMNTGHDGSMSTLHCNSAEDVVSRLESLILTGSTLPVEAIRRQIASALDIIVHVGRMRDKSRKVLEICEVLDYKEGEVHMNRIFYFEEEMGHREENSSSMEENKKVIGKLTGSSKGLHKIRKLEQAGFYIGDEL